jgi:hypothetical protein
MKFSTLLINLKTYEREEKVYTQYELTEIVGEFVVNRAIQRSETNTTIIKNNQSYKMLIKYLKD